jgi:hypothetical protein
MTDTIKGDHCQDCRGQNRGVELIIVLYENGEEQEGPIWRGQTHAAGLGAAH